MKITIVIPLYNEEKHIAQVLKDLGTYKFPIVVVDDGSEDSTSLKLRRAFNSQLTVLTHVVNLGKGAAMKTGAEYAFTNGAEAVIFMDSDGQHSSTDLAKFVNSLKQKNVDLVLGYRVLNSNVPIVRLLGNKIASFLVKNLFNIKVKDSLCGFRALTRRAYSKIIWDSSDYGVEIEMLARAGKKSLVYKEIPVETVYLDKNKGVTPLHAFGIIRSIIKWWVTL